VTKPDVAPERAGSGAGPTAATCAACGEELVAGAGFCEACGASTGQAAAVAAAPPPSSPDPDAAAASTATSASTPPCDRCGAAIGTDSYCTGCGVRALEPITVDDRGRSAFATHRGVRHTRNEDAAALATTAEGWPVLVVADGVSASPNPHLAAVAAVQAAVARLGGRPFDDPATVVAAVADAHVAASAVPHDTDASWPADGTHPACTIVVAVATPTEIHMANVGDARGYALRRDADGALHSAQLSTDDSVAAQAVAEGIPIDKALQLPGGHAITAWLGADAPAPEPHVSTSPVAASDVLFVCSDGLWNYASTEAELDRVLAEQLPDAAEPLGAPCERLVRWAIEQGGADNICVAITPITKEEAS
jgi:serine/threonine protein phosphatase PrpC